jgi:hypothetical protein
MGCELVKKIKILKVTANFQCELLRCWSDSFIKNNPDQYHGLQIKFAK